jgi:ketosteroid isomerase-like protein
VSALAAEASEAGAEELAPRAWATARDQRHRVDDRRRAGDVGAVPALAAEAERALTQALEETAEAAKQRAAAARARAELAGVDDTTTDAADRAFSRGEHHRTKAQRRGAAIAFRAAADGYDAATAACALAARQAEAAAEIVAREAVAAEAAELAADAYRAAVARRDAAAAALTAGRFFEAAEGFDVAAKSLRAAAEAATRARAHLDARHTEEVRTVVDAANSALRTACLAGDGAKLAELYTADAEIVRAGVPIVSGGAAIASFWRDVIANGVQELAIATRTFEASGALALTAGSITITRVDGAASIHRSLVVWKRDGGGWKRHRDVWDEGLR